MDEAIDSVFWTHLKKQLSKDDDQALWQLALSDVIGDLNCEYLWEDVRTPARIHLIIAKQSNWWRPHQAALHLGLAGDANAYQLPDWELHWYRDARSHPWKFLSSSIGKTKGQTAHCFTFVPARTISHVKAAVVQMWKPPISPGLPVTRAKTRRDASWFPDGMRFNYRRDAAGVWNRVR